MHLQLVACLLAVALCNQFTLKGNVLYADDSPTVKQGDMVVIITPIFIIFLLVIITRIICIRRARRRMAYNQGRPLV